MEPIDYEKILKSFNDFEKKVLKSKESSIEFLISIGMIDKTGKVLIKD